MALWKRWEPIYLEYKYNLIKEKRKRADVACFLHRHSRSLGNWIGNYIGLPDKGCFHFSTHEAKDCQKIGYRFRACWLSNPQCLSLWYQRKFCSVWVVKVRQLEILFSRIVFIERNLGLFGREGGKREMDRERGRRERYLEERHLDPWTQWASILLEPIVHSPWPTRLYFQ